MGDQEKAAVKYRFGLFEADPETGELRKSGIRIRVQAQPFRILVHLLERPNQVVSREELQRRFWEAETTIDIERSLAAAIHKIRESLGDSVTNPRFVETVARTGYRFIAPVTPVASKPVDPEPGGAAAPVEAAPEPVSLGDATGNPVPVISPSFPPFVAVRRRTWITVAIFGIAAATLVSWLILQHLQMPFRTPARIGQITVSGRIYPGDPSVESFPRTATDGSRIYFTEIEDGRIVLAETLINNRGAGTISLPEELNAPAIDDISRDGSRLLLSNRLATVPEQSLWVASTIGGMALRVPGVLAHDATWMPDGEHILYASGHDLFIVRNDGSESRKLVSLSGRAFMLRWSPEGNRLRLTLVDEKTHAASLWQVAADGSGPHRLLQQWTEASGECCGEWSRDGKLYLFQSMGKDGDNIWALPERAGMPGGPMRPIPITNGPLNYRAPIAAANDHQIFFVGLDPKSQLLRLDRPAGRFVPYPGSIRDAKRVEFSRDGQWVAWIRQSDGSVWRSRADGSEPLQLTDRPLDVLKMRWSPDGRRIALMARKTGEIWRVYLVDTVGGPLQQLLNEDRNEADPDWSPDGSRLVFGRPPGQMAEPSQPKAIYFADLNTRQMTKVPGSDGLFSPRWSSNGKCIAALSLDQSKLMIFDVAANAWRQLAAETMDNPTWSHDDSAIFFHDPVGIGQPLYKLDLSTHRTEKVFDLESLRAASIVDYRFSGLAPGDLPVIVARTSVADIYSAELSH